MSTHDSRRIVITGVGLVTALGVNTVEETWDAVVSGRSGVSLIETFDSAAFPTHIAAEIKNYQSAEYMDLKDSKRTDRSVHYAANAARQ